MNVRKRSGKVVPFDAEFIRRAVTLAAAAAGETSPMMPLARITPMGPRIRSARPAL